jgi:hypothetical protein
VWRRSAPVVLLAVALAAAAATSVRAAERMPIGFVDDPSFRWSPDRQANLAAAAAAGASVIHTFANWSNIAPTRPANAANGDDPAYRLQDLDELVRNAAGDGIRVMIDIYGTPKWANGGQTPNHPPRRLADLGTFAHMLALRYDGRTPGQGSVTLWSVWNEPNLQQFLSPQFDAKGKPVSPTNYAKLFKTVYAAIKSANPLAKVAIGETSAQGRDKPSSTSSNTMAPGTFAHLLAKVRGLRFDAWAHHPYPTARTAKPLEQVRYPNVTLSQLPRFEAQLAKDFHRAVPIWITEYGHETKPAQPKGVSLATQAAYARQALTVVRKDANVQMFLWFTFRDSAGNPWKSGLEQQSGAAKPAYAVFSALARVTDGATVTAKPGPAPTIRLYVPYIASHSLLGEQVGIMYHVTDGGAPAGAGEPTAALAVDQSVSFTPALTLVKGHRYTITAVVNDVHGDVVTRTTLIVVH